MNQTMGKTNLKREKDEIKSYEDVSLCIFPNLRIKVVKSKSLLKE